MQRISALADARQDTRAIQTWCATPNSHRPVQKFRALIGNPRSLQQLVGQLPICCCSKAKKFNDFARARGRMCLRGEQAPCPAFAFSNIDEVGVACLGNDNSGSNDRFVSPTQSAEDREIDIVVRKC